MDPFYYVAANGWGSACGLSLWDVPGAVLVVLSELPDNHGPSVTNNVEVVARRVVGLLGLDPQHTIVMEHYPAGAYAGPREETFDLVKLADAPATFFGTAGGGDRDGPEWTHMTPERWAELDRASGGLPWGVGPPKVTVPEELCARFDGAAPGDIKAFLPLVRECERQLAGEADEDEPPRRR